MLIINAIKSNKMAKPILVIRGNFQSEADSELVRARTIKQLNDEYHVIVLGGCNYEKITFEIVK
jgi:hypothetical protein